MTVRVLVCDDEPGLRTTLNVLFQRAGYDVTLAENVHNALDIIRDGSPFDLIVTDLSMPDGSGIEVLQAARERDESTQVIMITAYATTDQAVQAMRLGAYDYIQKPFRNDVLRATAEKALEKSAILHENKVLRENAQNSLRSKGLIGKSPAMQRITELVEKVANTRTNVLITGESGTGKEVVARLLHERSDRSSHPFVVVNCGALPETLMESELFGHEKGAFTGATTRNEGLVRRAHLGTLFLDEVGELPLPLQVKLLRVLQERKVRPVGGHDEVAVDVRVVAATNRDLEKEVHENRFRQDLFYRLNVLRVHLPPLRERPEDIALLAEYFVRRHSSLMGKRLTLSPEALRWVVDYRYPGNVRELENLMERAVTLASGGRIERADLPDEAASRSPLTEPLAASREADDSRVQDRPVTGDGFDLDAYLGDIERRILLQVLAECSDKRTVAAKKLGLTFRSFRYRLAKYGIAAEDEDETRSS
jgi:two-component system response regulator PilR (NtrC family)